MIPFLTTTVMLFLQGGRHRQCCFYLLCILSCKLTWSLTDSCLPGDMLHWHRMKMKELLYRWEVPHWTIQSVGVCQRESLRKHRSNVKKTKVGNRSIDCLSFCRLFHWCCTKWAKKPNWIRINGFEVKAENEEFCPFVGSCCRSPEPEVIYMLDIATVENRTRLMD